MTQYFNGVVNVSSICVYQGVYEEEIYSNFANMAMLVYFLEMTLFEIIQVGATRSQNVNLSFRVRLYLVKLLTSQACSQGLL